MEELLIKVRAQNLLGYQKIRQNILNSFLIKNFENSKVSLDHVVQNMQTNLHVGLASALEQLIEQQSKKKHFLVWRLSILLN
ncbi:MAG: hypothetical protein HWD61_14940 [Parachlamydiaceae bacterium]|nr:MAG: hypothetical protein HWD61_14940 [Parachlamydiaceae bacterium]